MNVQVVLGHVQEREEVRQFRLRLLVGTLSHLIIPENVPLDDLGLHLTLISFGLNDGFGYGHFTFSQEKLLIRRPGNGLDGEALLVHLLDLLLTIELFLPFISLSVMWRISMGRSLFGLDGHIAQWDHFNRGDRLFELLNSLHLLQV